MSAIEVVRNARARRLKLSVDPMSGRVRLVLPRRAALAPALAWADGQAAWIAAQRRRLPHARPFAPGATVPFMGTEVRLAHDPAAGRAPRLAGGVLSCGGPVERFGARVLRWMRDEALGVLAAETAEYALRAGVTVDRVAVGDPRARWGSCSSSGVIRYSWRLILAPAHVRRATVAHEVAHRLHMDHSAAFHAAVARIYEGDAVAARAWLRAHGAALHWFGRES